MKTIIFTLLLLVTATTIYAQQQISLAGEWHFAIDRNDKGISEKWFIQHPAETIILPGSMTTNSKGDDISLHTPWTGQIVDSSWFKNDEYAKYRTNDNLKIPAWLQPVKYYKGAAWYIKDIHINNTMANKPLEIYLERIHWESKLWIDGTFMATQNSLATPHRYTLPSLSEGRHTIALLIDNRIKEINVGQNAHSLSDHTQSNWNGIIGEMTLKTIEPISVKNIAIYPDIDKAQLKIELWLENTTDKDTTIHINLATTSKFTPSQHTPPATDNKIKAGKGITKHEITYPMGDNFYKWDEFTPYLYSITARIAHGEAKSYDFGMRKFESRDKRFYINDRPIFLRGTLECAIFPQTGYPPTTQNEWARIFNICKAHGLNHVRFHSWCPPRAAFIAADRIGMYLQIEGGGWCSVGSGNLFDKWIFTESNRILAEYGNHPSFILYTYGNEPDGANQAQFLGNLVQHLRTTDPRHLYTSAAGWPAIPQNQYRNDMYPRLKVWGTPSPLNTEKPRYNYQFDDMIAACEIPWVSHEIGQWCVYPDFREIDRYADAVLQAKNFEIFRETLSEKGLAKYALDFLTCSGKLQTLLYKTEIEAALRTKNFAGFQLLDLHDFPGQGTALVGVLNPFWESKGYVTAQEYHRFASSIVPIIRTEKIIFKNNETLTVPVEIANFGAAKLHAVTPSWRLICKGGRTFASGNLPTQDIEIGNCIPLGTISQSTAEIKKAEKLTLIIEAGGGSNSWDFWIYPANNTAILGETKITNKIDKQTLAYLEKGGKILLSPTKNGLKDHFGGNIKSGFTTIFWNSAWTLGNQPPLTLGLLNDTQHPALADFPTEKHSNFQWYELTNNPNIVNLTALGVELTPIVRVIDDWFKNRSLALLFEVRIGKGKLIYCGADLSQTQHPEIAQMKKSILDYMNSPEFEPKQKLTPNQITSIMK